MPSDEQIAQSIETLEQERERLRRQQSEAPGSSATDATQIEDIRFELDRLRDLKRQRQALRASGRDPDDAEERTADNVEGYWQ